MQPHCRGNAKENLQQTGTLHPSIHFADAAPSWGAHRIDLQALCSPVAGRPAGKPAEPASQKIRQASRENALELEGPTHLCAAALDALLVWSWPQSSRSCAPHVPCRRGHGQPHVTAEIWMNWALQVCKGKAPRFSSCQSWGFCLRLDRPALAVPANLVAYFAT